MPFVGAGVLWYLANSDHGTWYSSDQLPSVAKISSQKVEKEVMGDGAQA